MPLRFLNELERRDLARMHLDNVERWLRRLIDHQLRARFGEHYFAATLADRTSPIQKRIVDDVEGRREAEPERYPRPVDATIRCGIGASFRRYGYS